MPAPDQNPQPARDLRVKVDESNFRTGYANAFRSHASPEEVILDFGLDLLVQGPPDDRQPAEALFQVNHRLVLNYYTAKRLAIVLGQIIQAHEKHFGPIKLDAKLRAKAETT